MTDDRQRELMELRRDLSWVKNQIRENERIWSAFRQIAVGMIGAASLPEIIAVLVNDLPKTFRHVDRVSLAYFDPEFELARLVAHGEKSFADHSFISISSNAGVFRALFVSTSKPLLGPCTPIIQTLLFPHGREEFGSVALAPLLVHGRLVGSLNQASRNPGHFNQAVATDLLEHLAAVTAMCIENAVNRERLKQDGLTDALTGVANRRFFERRLEEEMQRWARDSQALACMLVDIDHFKQVNDRFGHQAGDVVLQRIAQTLGRDLRVSDVLARYGGEEFVLLLPNTRFEQAVAIAGRLREAVAEQVFNLGHKPPERITISLGLACLSSTRKPKESISGEELIRRADAALYQAKAAGRDRVAIAP
jgi:diguanylate cyclase (GGDEF)-like protein